MSAKREYPRAIIDNGRSLPRVSDPDPAPGDDSDEDGMLGRQEYLEIIATDLGRELAWTHWGEEEEPYPDPVEPGARLREFVAYLERRVEADRAPQLSQELTLLGTKVIGRFRMPMGQWIDRPGTERAELYKDGPFVHLTRRAKQGMDQEVEVTRRWLAHDSGSIGRTQEDGGIPFKPGSISFRGDNRPIPATLPDEVVNIIYQAQWERATSRPPSPEIFVGLFDTGIDETVAASNPLLAGALSRDPIDGTQDNELPSGDGIVDDVSGHGAHTAGIVVQRCPDVRVNIETVRSGRNRTSDSFELARDLRDVEHCDIVVFPLAVTASRVTDLPALRAVVEHLLAQAKVVVAAAGLRPAGNPEDQLYFPADLAFQREVRERLPGLLVRVGAVDADGNPLPGNRVSRAKLYPEPDTRADANSYGYQVASAYPNGLFQVGLHTQPLYYGDDCARWTGTSFASARVAGAIADRYLHPNDNESFASVVEAATKVIEEAEASESRIVS
ncbi:MAG: S8/S53 family peptidase [bacterium]|nr:S8/S53 family peptidase [bacterium]